MLSINTHIHLPPNFSAFDSVEQAVGLASEQGIRVLGASNYYDFTVYAEFERACLQRGITPLFGIEIVVRIPDLESRGVRVNDPVNPGKMYLCGKGINRWANPTPEAARLLRKVRANDARRMARMIDLIAGLFLDAGVDTGLDSQGVVEMVVARHSCPPETVTLQERHVALAFQEALFGAVPAGDRARALTAALGAPVPADSPVAVQGEIRSRLMKAGKPAFVAEEFISFEEAVLLIGELGGVPCYPVLADGAAPVCEYEADVDALVADLKARGITCAEFIPVRNEPATLERYVRALDSGGISVTAGTEHNTLDMLPLAPTCLKGAPIPDSVQDLFRAGTERLLRINQ